MNFCGKELLSQVTFIHFLQESSWFFAFMAFVGYHNPLLQKINRHGPYFTKPWFQWKFIQTFWYVWFVQIPKTVCHKPDMLWHWQYKTFPTWISIKNVLGLGWVNVYPTPSFIGGSFSLKEHPNSVYETKATTSLKCSHNQVHVI